MKQSTAIPAAALAATVALIACNVHAREAGSEEKPEKAAFAEIDTNKDGLISTREASENSSWVAANFTVIDTNRDGTISKAEFDKALG